MDAPQVRYARSGGLSVAYQVVGDGPVDLVYVPGWVSHLELAWEEPRLARFLTRLASFARVILFDKRGTGLSDRVADDALPTLEERMDDVSAVMGAAGSRRAVLFGYSEGGPMCALFAATYPERTAALVVYGSYARRLRSDDYPWGQTEEAYEAYLERFSEAFGGPVDLAARAPSVAADEAFRRWWARSIRTSVSPGALRTLHRMNGQIDVRAALPAIRVPALIVHRSGDALIDVGAGRALAAAISGARFVELPGTDHVPWVGDQEAVLAEIEAFVTGVRPPPEPDRVLATVLFTDLVSSTELVAELGDRRWRDLLETHHGVVRRQLERFRGREIDTAGDGFFAAFDGPARAVRCACAIRDELAALGIVVRAGLHTGECELIAGKPGGLAVNVGARVAARAAPGEVLATGTVKDLVAGSRIEFESRGEHELKGIPDRWRLFAVTGVDP